MEDEMQSLREENARIKAEAEANLINVEVQCQAMEARNARLATELREAREQAKRESERATEAIAARDEAAGRERVREEEARSARAGMDAERRRAEEMSEEATRARGLVERRNAEVAAREADAAEQLRRVASVTKERTEMEAKLRAALSKEVEFGLTESRLNQEKALLEKHSAWQTQEVDRLQTELDETKRAASAAAMEHCTNANRLDVDLLSTQKALAAANERLADLEAATERREREAHELRESSAEQVSGLEKELGTAIKLSELYKEQVKDIGEKLEARTAEGEKLREELRTVAKEQEEIGGQWKTRTKDLQEELAAKEEELSNLRLLVPQPGADDGGRADGSVAAVVPQAEERMTTLYTKFEAASEGWRKERAERRRVESMLEQVIHQLEMKAPEIDDQRREHERLTVAYDRLAARLHATSQEKVSLDAALAKAGAERTRDHREIASLKKSVEDTSKQVRFLLSEKMDSSGVSRTSKDVIMGPDSSSLRRGAGGASPGGCTGGEIVTVDSVISENLLTFRDVEELQEKNMKLLAVTRDLASKQEEDESRIREELLQEHGERAAALGKEIQMLKTTVNLQEEQISSIARQRDVYKSLVEDANSEKAVGGKFGSPATGAPGAGAADAGTAAAAAVATSALTSPPPGRVSPNIRAGPDLLEELEKVRTESAEHARMMADDIEKSREEASLATSKAARAAADLKFEQERHQRSQEMLASARAEVAQLTERTSGLNSTVLQHEQELRNAMTDLESSRERLRQAQQLNASLEAEKRIVEAAERRAAAEVQRVTTLYHQAQVELETSRKIDEHNAQSADSEKKRLLSEVEGLGRQVQLMQSELREERNRVRDLSMAQNTNSSANDSRVVSAEAREREAKETASLAVTRASVAEAKIEVLENSLTAAEARLSTILRGTSADALGSSSEAGNAQLAAEAVAARKELVSAQEAAAEARGHADRYKELARESDASFADLKQKYDALVSEGAARTAELADGARKLDEERAAVAEQVNAVKVSYEEKVASLVAKVAQLEADVARALESEAASKGSVDEATKLVDALKSDVEDALKQYRHAKESYERELIAHAESVGKLNELEKTSGVAVARASELDVKVKDAEHALGLLEATKAAEIAEMTTELDIVKDSLRDARAQNKSLHDRIAELTTVEAGAGAMAPAIVGSAKGPDQERAGGNPSSSDTIIAYMRKEKDALEVRLSLVEQELKRWQVKAENAMKSADAAMAQMASMSSAAAAETRAEQDQDSVAEQLKYLNILRESNVTLRAQNEANAKLAREWEAKAQAAEEALDPLRKNIAELEASIESSAHEIGMATQAAERWKKRSEGLIAKYGKIDINEYKKLESKLSETTEKLEKASESVKAEVDAAKVKAEEAAKAATEELEKTRGELQKATTAHEADRKQLQIAKKQIFNTFNPQKKPLAKWKQDQEETLKKIAELEAQVQAMAADAEAPSKPAAALETMEAQVKSLEAQVKSLEGAKAIAEGAKAEAETAVKGIEGKLATEKAKFEKVYQILQKAKKKENENKSLIESLQNELTTLKAASDPPAKGEDTDAAAAAAVPAAPASGAMAGGEDEDHAGAKPNGHGAQDVDMATGNADEGAAVEAVSVPEPAPANDILFTDARAAEQPSHAAAAAPQQPSSERPPEAAVGVKRGRDDNDGDNDGDKSKIASAIEADGGAQIENIVKETSNDPADDDGAAAKRAKLNPGAPPFSPAQPPSVAAEAAASAGGPDSGPPRADDKLPTAAKAEDVAKPSGLGVADVINDEPQIVPASADSDPAVAAASEAGTTVPPAAAPKSESPFKAKIEKRLVPGTGAAKATKDATPAGAPEAGAASTTPHRIVKLGGATKPSSGAGDATKAAVAAKDGSDAGAAVPSPAAAGAVATKSSNKQAGKAGGGRGAGGGGRGGAKKQGGRGGRGGGQQPQQPQQQGGAKGGGSKSAQDGAK